MVQYGNIYSNMVVRMVLSKQDRLIMVNFVINIMFNRCICMIGYEMGKSSVILTGKLHPSTARIPYNP